MGRSWGRRSSSGNNNRWDRGDGCGVWRRRWPGANKGTTEGEPAHDASTTFSGWFRGLLDGVELWSGPVRRAQTTSMGNDRAIVSVVLCESEASLGGRSSIVVGKDRGSADGGLWRAWSARSALV